MDQPVVVLLSALALCCAGVRSQQRISPDQLLTSDVSPSRHSNNRHGLQSETYLPPGFWTENLNKRPARKPTKAERNPAELMAMLEKEGHWNPRFMRLGRRDRTAMGKISKSRRGAKKFERPSVRILWRESRLLRKPKRWSQQTAYEASEMLFSLGNCSAVKHWLKLDRLFWPRQLLVTECAATSAARLMGMVPGGPPQQPQTCGWPPGKLACRNVPFNVHILRWICMPKANGSSTGLKESDKKFTCKWFEVPYTITKDCECNLPESSNEDH